MRLKHEPSSVLLPAVPEAGFSGDTAPCRMTGVTLHSHVRHISLQRISGLTVRRLECRIPCACPTQVIYKPEERFYSRQKELSIFFGISSFPYACVPRFLRCNNNTLSLADPDSFEVHPHTRHSSCARVNLGSPLNTFRAESQLQKGN